ncbi:unnamed protein product [Camellia sinensis]
MEFADLPKPGTNFRPKSFEIDLNEALPTPSISMEFADFGVLWLRATGRERIRRTTEYVNRKQSGGLVVTCTAEGLERGLLVGGRGQEGKFAVPERFKVVALMACVMCLCNADRVVMSVAIVPLAAKHGWNSSFLGIVQITKKKKKKGEEEKGEGGGGGEGGGHKNRLEEEERLGRRPGLADDGGAATSTGLGRRPGLGE